jgi:hypothetical protein
MRFTALILLLVIVATSATASALGRRRRSSTYNYEYSYSSVDYGDAQTDQELAQVEANYMAKHHSSWHVGRNLGGFEGCGWSGSIRNCATCVPGYGMTLTADAAAQDNYGRWYRVRVWR